LNSNVYKYPVGATLLRKAVDKTPLPVPREKNDQSGAAWEIDKPASTTTFPGTTFNLSKTMEISIW
jgi:hypothetical protein